MCHPGPNNNVVPQRHWGQMLLSNMGPVVGELGYAHATARMEHLQVVGWGGGSLAMAKPHDPQLPRSPKEHKGSATHQ